MSKIKQSGLAKEVNENPRLQWMLVLIAAILTLSLSKSLIDDVQQGLPETRQQLDMVARLQASADTPLDQTQLDTIERQFNALKTSIPQANSSSVAEASALSDIERKVGKLLNKNRLNLLGSERLQGSSNTFWTVRVDISGQLKPENVVEFLKHFDNSAANTRIASMRYMPKTSDSINLVVDMIYKEGDSE